MTASVPPPPERPGKAAELPWPDRVHPVFPEALPITAALPEIRRALEDRGIVIVCGATGSGKTTQLPKLALACGCGRRGRIGCTQPRRIAASSLARRVAAELQVELGNEVGYKVRFDDHTVRETVIKFMTDGILLAETRFDPLLKQYDCLMLDEVHERSLNVDFLLGYLKKIRSKRPDLKVIISSATLEAEKMAAFFDGAPLVEVPGRLYPIDDVWLPPEADEELSESVARAVDFLSELDPKNDVLVFLPGEREIRDALELLTGRKLPATEILPLYGRLSAGEQNRIFTAGRRRRIVLATNVAETSLTIPGIRCVIDSGQVRLSRYNPRTRIQELRIETVSQAAMRQRRGRCGRLADGVCVHLYSEDDAARMEPFTDPEIKRSALAGVILQMAALHLPPIDRFPLVDPPSPGAIREGLRTLTDLGAIDKSLRLTPAGHKLAALPVDPHLGRMILAGYENHCAPETLIAAAFLSIPDPRERPIDKAAQAETAHRKFASERSDFLAILNLWTALSAVEGNNPLRRFAKENFLNFRRLREWRNLADDLAGMLKIELNRCSVETLQYDLFHQSLLSGLPRQLAHYDREKKLYADMNGRGFYLFPGSGLARRKNPPEWLMSFALVETSRLFARQNAEARPEWLAAVAPWICTPVYDQAHYDGESGFVFARKKVLAGKLLIHPGSRCHYAAVDPAACRTMLIRDGLVKGDLPCRSGWLGRYVDRLQAFRDLEQKIRRPGMVVDEESLARFFEEKLPPEAVSVKALLAWSARSAPHFTVPDEAFLLEGAERYLDDRGDYPDAIRFGGAEFAFSYVFDPGAANDGVTMLVPEDSLNLLPGWALECLPPGFLIEKCERLLRSLPKSQRQQLLPLSAALEAFAAFFRKSGPLGARPVLELFSDFLLEYAGINVRPRDLEAVEMPEYLTLKLAVLDRDGNVREILRELPQTLQGGSRFNAALPEARPWRSSGAKAWPPVPALPEEVRLGRDGGQPVYPALCDEGDAVGTALYLKRAEAAANHERGLFRLLQLQIPELLRMIRRDFRFGPDLIRWFFAGSGENEWRDALLMRAVLDALGSAEERWRVRSQKEYADLREAARPRFAAAADAVAAALKELEERRLRIAALLRKLPQGCWSAENVRRQLEWARRPGFLNDETGWKRLPRYFRALELRLQRAVSEPAKDARKGESIAEWEERFFLAAESAGENAALNEYRLLLEEARITLYAPEVRPLEKATPAVLAARWEELRF